MVFLMLGAVLLLYVLGFAVLTLSPQAGRVAQAMGLSEKTLEKVYYPILRLLR